MGLGSNDKRTVSIDLLLLMVPIPWRRTCLSVLCCSTFDTHVTAVAGAQPGGHAHMPCKCGIAVREVSAWQSAVGVPHI